MQREEILRKIEKLLRVAEGKANINESILAASMAQELMLKYNLKLEDVPKEAEITEEYIEENIHSIQRRWERHLLGVICKANFCRAIMVARSKAALIGKESNLKMVRFMFAYLHREINRLAKEYSNQTDRIKIFSIGAVSEIARRLAELKNNVQVTKDSKALMVVLENEIQLAYQKLHPNAQTINSPTIRGNSDAYNNGKEAGRNIPFNKPIEGAVNNRRLICR